MKLKTNRGMLALLIAAVCGLLWMEKLLHDISSPSASGSENAGEEMHRKNNHIIHRIGYKGPIKREERRSTSSSKDLRLVNGDGPCPEHPMHVRLQSWDEWER